MNNNEAPNIPHVPFWDNHLIDPIPVSPNVRKEHKKKLCSQIKMTKQVKGDNYSSDLESFRWLKKNTWSILCFVLFFSLEFAHKLIRNSRVILPCRLSSCNSKNILVNQNSQVGILWVTIIAGIGSHRVYTLQFRVGPVM